MFAFAAAYVWGTGVALAQGTAVVASGMVIALMAEVGTIELSLSRLNRKGLVIDMYMNVRRTFST